MPPALELDDDLGFKPEAAALPHDDDLGFVQDKSAQPKSSSSPASPASQPRLANSDKSLRMVHTSGMRMDVPRERVGDFSKNGWSASGEAIDKPLDPKAEYFRVKGEAAKRNMEAQERGEPLSVATPEAPIAKPIPRPKFNSPQEQIRWQNEQAARNIAAFPRNAIPAQQQAEADKIKSLRDQEIAKLPPEAQAKLRAADWQTSGNIAWSQNRGTAQQRAEDRESVGRGSEIPDWSIPTLAAANEYVAEPINKTGEKIGKWGAGVAENAVTPQYSEETDLLNKIRAGTATPQEVEQYHNLQYTTKAVNRSRHPVITGGARAAGETGAQLLNPVYAPLLFTGGGAGAKLLSAGFGVQMAHGTIAQADQLSKVWYDPNVPQDKKVEMAVGIVMSTLLAKKAGGHAFTPKPVAPPPPMDEATASMVRFGQASGEIPTPPPEPPPRLNLNPDRINDIGEVLAALPDEHRQEVLTGVHGQIAKAMLDQGTFTGPDGKLYIVRNPQQAELTAQKLINDSIDAHDTRMAEQQKAQAESAKTAQTKPAIKEPAPVIRRLIHSGPQPRPPAKATLPEVTPISQYDTAKQLVDEFGKASTSLLQRRLKISYAEASQYIDRMVNDGFINKATRERIRVSAPVAGKAAEGMTQDVKAVKEAQQAPTTPGQQPQIAQKVEPAGNQAKIDQPPAPVNPAEASKVGTEDLASGRQITQPTSDEIHANQLAAEAAPELVTRLSKVAAEVPGAKFDRMRPQKDLPRVGEKVEDGKPVNTIPDFSAAQIAADTPAAKDALIEKLKQEFGPENIISIEDKFTEPRKDLAGYASANVQIRNPNGISTEVQIVPREQQAVSVESHKFYSAGREAELRGDTAERDRQFAQAEKLNTQALDKFNERNGKQDVTPPPGYELERSSPLSDFDQPSAEDFVKQHEAEHGPTPEVEIANQSESGLAEHGTGATSAEELARGEKFYRIKKNGSLSYQGVSPDANLADGESLIAVKPDGSMRMQDSKARVGPEELLNANRQKILDAAQIKPVGEPKESVFHGTSEDKIPSILQNGLTPESGKVWVGDLSTARRNGRGAVVEIEKPKEMADHFNGAKITDSSGKETQQWQASTGHVPASSIKSVKVFDKEGNVVSERQISPQPVTPPEGHQLEGQPQSTEASPGTPKEQSAIQVNPVEQSIRDKYGITYSLPHKTSEANFKAGKDRFFLFKDGAASEVTEGHLIAAEKTLGNKDVRALDELLKNTGAVRFLVDVFGDGNVSALSRPTDAQMTKLAASTKLFNFDLHDGDRYVYGSKQTFREFSKAVDNFYGVQKQEVAPLGYELPQESSTSKDNIYSRMSADQRDIKFHTARARLKFLETARNPNLTEIENTKRQIEQIRSANDASMGETPKDTTGFEPGSMRGSAFGLDIAAQAIAKAAPPVKAAIEKAGFWQRHFGPENKQYRAQARDLEQGIKDLDKHHEARSIQIGQALETAAKESTQADRLAVDRHIDNELVGKESQLTQEQQEIRDRYVEPLQRVNNELFNELKESDIPTEFDPNYLHRIPIDKPSQLRNASSEKGGSGKGNILKKTSGELKGRNMMAIEDASGNRRVVSIKSGDVTGFDADKEPIHLGADNLKPAGIDGKIKTLQGQADALAQVKGRAPGQQSVHGIEVSFNQRKAISEQIEALEEQKKNIGWPMDDRQLSGPARTQIRNLEEEIATHQLKRASVLDQYSEARLGDKVFTDKDGKEWKVTEATKDEIEQQSNTQYYRDPVAVSAASYISLSKAVEAKRFLEDWQQSEAFKNVAIKPERGESAPEGWKKIAEGPISNVFPGTYFEPRTADVLNNLSKKMTAKNSTGILGKIADLAQTSILLNPLMHAFNMADFAVVNRGIAKNANILSYGTAGRTLKDATVSVITRDANYVKVLDAGGNLLSHKPYVADLNSKFMDVMTSAMEQDKGLATKVADLMGLKKGDNPIAALRRYSHGAAFASNDIFYMQSVMEKQAAGKTLAQAVAETNKIFPDYQIPTRVLDSKMIADIMRIRALTWFNGYHMGKARAYANMLKGAFKADSTPEMRQQAMSQIAMLALMGAVIYPTWQSIARKATGEPNAKVRKFGLTSLPSDIYEMSKGDKSFSQVAQSQFTPSSLVKAAIEAGMNRDYAGNYVYNPEDSVPKKVGQAISHSVKTTFGPAQQIASYKRDDQPGAGKRALLRFGLGMSFPHPMTDAEKLMQKFIRVHHVPETPEEQDQYREQRERIASGETTQADRKKMLREIKYNEYQRLLPHLRYSEMKRVYDAATPEEKDMIEPVLNKERLRLLRRDPDEAHRQGADQ